MFKGRAWARSRARARARSGLGLGLGLKQKRVPLIRFNKAHSICDCI